MPTTSNSTLVEFPILFSAILRDLTTVSLLSAMENKMARTTGKLRTHGELHGVKKVTSRLSEEKENAVLTLLFLIPFLLDFRNYILNSLDIVINKTTIIIPS